MYTSTLGLSQGEFTELKVLQNDTMTNILDIVGGGSSGTVETASPPLQISAGGDISIDTSGLATTGDLANKIDTLTAIAPISVSGTGSSRYFSTLFKPSSVTVSQGLFALGSDNLGTLSLALTGQESRTQVRLQDPSTSIIRVLSTVAVISCGTASRYQVSMDSRW